MGHLFVTSSWCCHFCRSYFVSSRSPLKLSHCNMRLACMEKPRCASMWFEDIIKPGREKSNKVLFQGFILCHGYWIPNYYYVNVKCLFWPTIFDIPNHYIKCVHSFNVFPTNHVSFNCILSKWHTHSRLERSKKGPIKIQHSQTEKHIHLNPTWVWGCKTRVHRRRQWHSWAKS